MNLQPHLSNNKVLLRPLQLDDFEGLYEVASDPLLWEQHPRNNRYQKEVFAELFNERFNSKGALVIINQESQKIIGSSGYYDLKQEEQLVVIGYTFLSRDFWGTGLNREIKKLMINYAFQFVRHVLFHIGETNIRSKKAIEKIGAIAVDSFEKENIDGTSRKTIIYKITK